MTKPASKGFLKALQRARQEPTPELTVDVEGHTHDYLHFRAYSSCGEIKDGVAFAHWGTAQFTGKDCEGGWVISFTDLERMYLMAKKLRS